MSRTDYYEDLLYKIQSGKTPKQRRDFIIKAILSEIGKSNINKKDEKTLAHYIDKLEKDLYKVDNKNSFDNLIFDYVYVSDRYFMEEEEEESYSSESVEDSVSDSYSESESESVSDHSSESEEENDESSCESN